MAELSNKIYFVVGPTATGKSTWSLEQAIKLNGAIVNADSVQVYRGLNIGSAKPTIEEQKRVPHFLYDIAEPNENFTVGDYCRAAQPLVESQLREHNIFVVGGSGFYLQALEKGIFDLEPVGSEIESQVNEIHAQGVLFSEVQKRDPLTAKRVGPNDEYRLKRALMVMLSSGQTMTEVEASFAKSKSGLASRYSIQKIGFACDRELLRQRVLKRVRKMLKSGLIEEVESLIAKGFGETKALKTIGYRECAKYLSGGISAVQLEQDIVQSTMQLAKKQMTWFKRDKEIQWIQSPMT